MHEVSTSKLVCLPVSASASDLGIMTSSQSPASLFGHKTDIPVVVGNEQHIQNVLRILMRDLNYVSRVG